MSGVGSQAANRAGLAEEVMLQMSAGRSGLSRELLNTRFGRFLARRVMDTGVLGRILDPQLYAEVLRREQEQRAKAVLDEASRRFAASQDRGIGRGIGQVAGMLDPRGAGLAMLGGLQSLGRAFGVGLRWAATGGGDVRAMLDAAKAAAGRDSMLSLAPSATGVDAVALAQRLQAERRSAQDTKALQRKATDAAVKQVEQQMITNRNLERATDAIRQLGGLIGVVR
jgi:hypothetical protein